MKQKFATAFIGLATGVAEIFLIYLWVFNDVQWAGNLIRFWLVFGLLSVILGTSTESKEKLRKKGRFIPKEIAYVFYITAIALLAAQGYFLFAAIYTLAALIEIGIFEGQS